MVPNDNIRHFYTNSCKFRTYLLQFKINDSKTNEPQLYQPTTPMAMVVKNESYNQKYGFGIIGLIIYI